MVVAGAIDGEFGEEFAVVVDDVHVAVGDEEHDAGACVAAADAEATESLLVAQGDVAAAVDPVVASACQHSLGSRLESAARSSWVACGVGGR